MTHRDLAAQVTIVTAHERPGKPRADVDWAALAGLPGTLVVLMGVARLGAVAAALIAAGKAPRDARLRDPVGNDGRAAQRRRQRSRRSPPTSQAAGIRSPGGHGDRRGRSAARAARVGRVAAAARAAHRRHARASPGQRPRASGCAISAQRSTSARSSASSRWPGPPIDAAALRARLRHVAERPAPAARALRRRCACAGRRDGRGHRAGHRRGAARGGARRRRRRRALASPRGCWRRFRPISRACARSSRAPRKPATRCPTASGPPARTSTSCRSTARSRPARGTPSACSRPTPSRSRRPPP